MRVAVLAAVGEAASVVCLLEAGGHEVRRVSGDAAFADADAVLVSMSLSWQVIRPVLLAPPGEGPIRLLVAPAGTTRGFPASGPAASWDRPASLALLVERLFAEAQGLGGRP